MQAEEVAQIYQEQTPVMFRWLYKVGVPELAEDVIATAWCNALGHECRNLKAYVWRCLRNARVSAFRRRRIHEDIDNLQLAGPDMAEQVEARLARADAQTRLLDLVLDRKERALVGARLEHDWVGERLADGTWLVVGESLGITPGAAKARWLRLQRRMQAAQKG